jgi:hypothetical protein
MEALRCPTTGANPLSHSSAGRAIQSHSPERPQNCTRNNRKGARERSPKRACIRILRTKSPISHRCLIIVPFPLSFWSTRAAGETPETEVWRGSTWPRGTCPSGVAPRARRPRRPEPKSAENCLDEYPERLSRLRGRANIPWPEPRTAFRCRLPDLSSTLGPFFGSALRFRSPIRKSHALKTRRTAVPRRDFQRTIHGSTRFDSLWNGHDGVPSVNQEEQELAAGFPLDVERKARRHCKIISNERRSLRPVCRNVQLKLLIAAIRNADSVGETSVPIPWYSNYLR